MVEIVIKLPDKTYHMINAGYYDYGDMNLIIQNGMILPKGHGRLIDVNSLLDRIGLEDNDSNREENVGEIITLEDFDFTPTIIPADTSESEAKNDNNKV